MDSVQRQMENKARKMNDKLKQVYEAEIEDAKYKIKCYSEIKS